MHPCCNGSLQTGTKVIAILQLVLSILLCVLGVFSLSFGGLLTAFGVVPDEDEASSSEETGHINSPSGINGTDSPSDNTDVAIFGIVLMVLSCLLIFAGALSIIISVVLLIGANKRNRTYCKVWFVLNLIAVSLGVISLIGEIFSGESIGESLLHFGILSLTGYFLWVVWAFMEELKGGVSVSPYSNCQV